ncbi:MAG: P22 phage major capsid protein family protein [Rhodospirillaceae bacterium]
MANTLVTPEWVTFEVARYFVNSLRGVAQFNRTYSDEYVQSGAKVGDTVKVRLPQQFEASDGEALTIQNLLDRTVNVVLNRRRHVGFGWSSAQATTDIDDIRNRYVMPAAETLANVYDRVSMADVYKSVYNAVGTLGTTPNAALTYSQAKVRILDFAGPDDGLVAILDPWSNATIAASTSALFHPARQIGENWTTGQFANDQLGISKWFSDQNVPRFTSGSATGASTPVINGANQTGSSIVTSGWGSGTANLKRGDIVTFAGVYAVNPLSKESTGRLHQFVLTADVSDAAGAATLSISPSIVTSGALQNVTGSPADAAAVTYWAMAAGGTQAAVVSPQNLVFHPDAFASVMADLVMPNGGARATRVNSKQINIAMRYVEQFQITTDQNLNRLDILFGSAPIQERMACRVVS